MEITDLLRRLDSGEAHVLNQVIPLVYDELKKLARAHVRGEAPHRSLQPTALVHEAFVKMAGGRHPSYENRSHFLGIASRLMRQILVDAARSRSAGKRDAARNIPLDCAPDIAAAPCRDVLALEDALQELERSDEFHARLIEMKYFSGMTAEETAAALHQPVHSVRRELRLAQAWLRLRLSAAG